eukprot:29041-Eustigmatos_ZCMA.PRE.1
MNAPHVKPYWSSATTGMCMMSLSPATARSCVTLPGSWPQCQSKRRVKFHHSRLEMWPNNLHSNST